MRPLTLALSLCTCIALAQDPPAAESAKTEPKPPDPIATMVGRLNLDAYKATIKGLTKFGDRRQGTDRNRAALDWIEAQLKSNGCTNTERIHFEYTPPANPARRNPSTMYRLLRMTRQRNPER